MQQSHCSLLISSLPVDQEWCAATGFPIRHLPHLDEGGPENDLDCSILFGGDGYKEAIEKQWLCGGEIQVNLALYICSQG